MSAIKVPTEESADVQYQFVGKCPVCQSKNRKILYQGMKDYRCAENSIMEYVFYLCLNSSTFYVGQ